MLAAGGGEDDLCAEPCGGCQDYVGCGIAGMERQDEVRRALRTNFIMSQHTKESPEQPSFCAVSEQKAMTSALRSAPTIDTSLPITEVRYQYAAKVR